MGEPPSGWLGWVAETPRPKVPAKSTQELWKAVSGESPRRCSGCGCLEAAFQNVAVEPAAPDLLYGRSSVVSPSRGLSTRMLPVDQSHFLSLLSTQPCGEEEEEGRKGEEKQKPTYSLSVPFPVVMTTMIALIFISSAESFVNMISLKFSIPEFLNFSTTDALNQIVLCCGGLIRTLQYVAVPP